MSDPDYRIVEFDKLNLLGKAVFIGGQVVRVAGQLLEVVVERTADLIGDAEKAFREATDDRVEDATIVDELPGKPEKD